MPRIKKELIEVKQKQQRSILDFTTQQRQQQRQRQQQIIPSCNYQIRNYN